jgi:hypothetical protein
MRSIEDVAFDGTELAIAAPIARNSGRLIGVGDRDRECLRIGDNVYDVIVQVTKKELFRPEKNPVGNR